MRAGLTPCVVTSPLSNLVGKRALRYPEAVRRQSKRRALRSAMNAAASERRRRLSLLRMLET